MPRNKKPRFTEEEMRKKQKKCKEHIMSIFKSTGISTFRIDKYGTTCEICNKHEGNIYTLDKNLSDVFPMLEEFPPFCNDCSHSILPAPYTPEALAKLRKLKLKTKNKDLESRKDAKKESDRLERVAMKKAGIDQFIQEKFVDSDGETRIRLIDNPEYKKALKKIRSGSK